MDGQAELSDTKMELLLAAERLFAKQGIAATTIRQINLEAGQKNSSAIHYHFGSRDAILDAIIAIRVAPANAKRVRLLKEALSATGGAALSAESIVDILLKPSIDRFTEQQGPHFTLRFLIQLRMNIEAWRRYERERQAWTLVELQNELRRARPYLPPQVVRNRFRNAINFTMFEMAEIEGAEERLGARYSREEAAFRIEELKAILLAMLDAPVSARTGEALAKIPDAPKQSDRELPSE